MTRLREVRDGTVEVAVADGTMHHSPRVIVAADAWTNDLLDSFDRRLPLTVIEAHAVSS